MTIKSWLQLLVRLAPNWLLPGVTQLLASANAHGMAMAHSAPTNRRCKSGLSLAALDALVVTVLRILFTQSLPFPVLMRWGSLRCSRLLVILLKDEPATRGHRIRFAKVRGAMNLRGTRCVS